MTDDFAIPYEDTLERHELFASFQLMVRLGCSAAPDIMKKESDFTLQKLNAYPDKVTLINTETGVIIVSFNVEDTLQKSIIGTLPYQIHQPPSIPISVISCRNGKPSPVRGNGLGALVV